MVDGLPARTPDAVLVPHQKRQGLPAETLDPHIKRAADALGKTLDVWDKLQPAVEKFMESTSAEVKKWEADSEAKFVSRKDGKPVTRDAWLREVTHDFVTWTEKVARALTSMTKATDEAARLRSWITGDDDFSRPDLQNASDVELIQLLIDVVIARRLWSAVKKRAVEMGVELDG